MEIKRVPISLVDPWKKNPRGITVEGRERLRRQIEKHGVYKPLIVCPSGKRFICLGGNMRLGLLRERGDQEIDVSIVHPKGEAEMIEFALSDNDRVGKYDLPALAEMLGEDGAGVAIEDYRVSSGDEQKVVDFLGNYGPGLEPDEKALDENLPTSHVCQECGYKW